MTVSDDFYIAIIAMFGTVFGLIGTLFYQVYKRPERKEIEEMKKDIVEMKTFIYEKLETHQTETNKRFIWLNDRLSDKIDQLREALNKD